MRALLPGTPCGVCRTPMIGGPHASWFEKHRAGGLCCRCYQWQWRRQHPRIPREVDVIAVERAVRGDPPATLTPRERREAIAALTRYGRSAAEISRQLAITPRTVIRHRAALRVAA